MIVLDFPGIEGTKRRPAIILSSDIYHATRPDLIVGLITSQTAAASGPTDYFLRDWSLAGLRLPSAFRSFIVTVPASEVIVRIGRLSDQDWQAVRDSVKTALVNF